MGTSCVRLQFPSVENSSPPPDVYSGVMPANDSLELRIRGHGRRLVSGALFAVILIGASYVGGCSHGNQKPGVSGPSRHQAGSSKDQKRPEPESTLKVEFSKARVLWNDPTGRRVMDAGFREAVVLQTGQNGALELRGVRANLYKDGKIVSILTAPKVVADSKTREVKATGGVRVTSVQDGTSAVSEQIIWKARADKISGTGTVKMTKGNMFINAQSFEADTALKKARFREAEMGMN